MKKVVFAILVFVIGGTAVSADDYFFSTGISRQRALAMGAAYHSIEDDFSSGFYNPGGFKTRVRRDERNIRFYLNPAAMLSGFYDFSRYDRDFNRDDELTASQALASAALLLKGVTYTSQNFNVGLGLSEEIINTSPGIHGSRMLSVENLSMQSFHSLFFNLKIAPNVSMGIASTLYSIREGGKDEFAGGYTFGVLLSPNPKLNVGIAYNTIPDKFANSRMEIESIENESAIAGISYYPENDMVISLDLRTVNKDDRPTSREIHTGIEKKFMNRIALRGGYFRRKATEDNVFTFGIGILPFTPIVSRYSKLATNDLAAYTLILENGDRTNRLHVLSMLFRY